MKFAIFAAAALVTATTLSASGAILRPNVSDATVRAANSAGRPVEVIDTTFYAATVGEYFSPGSSNYVVAFQLPTLAAGETFSDSNLFTRTFGRTATTTAGVTTFLYNIDLYGLGVRTDPTVLTSDYFAGGPIDAANTLIQAAYADPTTTGAQDVNTNALGDATLTAYLNTSYASGANAGRYVFFRLNINQPATVFNTLTFLTANAGGLNTEQPRIDYSTVTGTVPEPTSLALLSLGGLSMLRRRSR